MKSQPIDEYFAALDRLKNSRPLNVPKGTKITKDSVSLEAGRGNGSIKKSRPIFSDLIQAIEIAAEEQSRGSNQLKVRADKYKSLFDDMRSERDAGLAREISLLDEVYSLKETLRKLTGENVLPIRPNNPGKV